MWLESNFFLVWFLETCRHEERRREKREEEKERKRERERETRKQEREENKIKIDTILTVKLVFTQSGIFAVGIES